MEIEKVIRILTLLLGVAALAIHFATRLLFPGTSGGIDLLLVIVVVLCLVSTWRQTGRKSGNSL